MSEPTETEITEYLISQGAPADWAAFLTGLPWEYLKPVVKIAMGSGVHPALALGTAAVFTEDNDFKTAAAAHLERTET
jgi:hypothetical protein